MDTNENRERALAHRDLAFAVALGAHGSADLTVDHIVADKPYTAASSDGMANLLAAVLADDTIGQPSYDDSIVWDDPLSSSQHPLDSWLTRPVILGVGRWEVIARTACLVGLVALALATLF